MSGLSSELHVRPVTPEDRDWVEQRLRDAWGAVEVVSRGRLHDASALPGLVAEAGGEAGGEPLGLATYRVAGDACELVTIDAYESGRGVGTRLLEAVADEARHLGCRRLWLITTNDNIDALRFYQRRGLHLVAVHVDAVAASRRLKPGIALVGQHGIPIRDELELGLDLTRTDDGR
jgi:GNAT superfamily N-acetyltransferase